jgi:uncharacterized protein YkwD
MALIVGIGATACMDVGPPPTDPWQSGILNAMNQDRINNGLPALSWSPRLAASAGPHSGDMANAGYIFHSDLNFLLNSPDFTHFWTLGENVIVGPPGSTPASFETAWMNSPGHRANILNPNFNVAGVGVWIGSDGRVYGTVLFGGHD